MTLTFRIARHAVVSLSGAPECPEHGQGVWVHRSTADRLSLHGCCEAAVRAALPHIRVERRPEPG